jgi:hypothetical protein
MVIPQVLDLYYTKRQLFTAISQEPKGRGKVEEKSGQGKVGKVGEKSDRGKVGTGST